MASANLSDPATSERSPKKFASMNQNSLNPNSRTMERISFATILGSRTRRPT